EGMLLQREINTAEAAGQMAMAGAMRGLEMQVGKEETEGLDVLASDAIHALSMQADTEHLKAQLNEKEQAVAERLAGLHLAVHALDNDRERYINRTYFSGGATGAHRQVIGGVFQRSSAKGTFRTAFLGQNALVLYPQWLSTKQLDRGHLIVPILTEDEKPN